MGISVNVNVRNENEFNQQLQMYITQGYNIQSNFGGTAILKKKSFSVGLLIVLVIFFFPLAVVYYLLSSDDVVTIKLNNAPQSTSNEGFSTNTNEVGSYCPNCGQTLLQNSKFCPGCGENLNHEDN